MRLRLTGECVLIAGMRGAGKSNLLPITIGEVAACLDVVLWRIDLKYGLELGPWERVFDQLTHDLTDAEQLLEAAGRVMDAQGQLLAKAPARTGSPHLGRPLWWSSSTSRAACGPPSRRSRSWSA